MVWSSASSTLISVLVSAFVFSSSPNTHPLRSVGASGKALYRLHHSGPGSSPLRYRERHPHHGAPRKFKRYSPNFVEVVFSEVHGSKRPVERDGKHTRAAFGNPFGVETRGSSTF